MSCCTVGLLDSILACLKIESGTCSGNGGLRIHFLTWDTHVQMNQVGDDNGPSPNLTQQFALCSAVPCS